MTACTQPGCTGAIVDGYCDVCGSPGADAASAHASSSPSSAAVSAAGGACTQPGCGGTIVDGYCDVCGTPAAGTPPAPSPPSRVSTATNVRSRPDRAPGAGAGRASTAAPGAAGTGSTLTRASSRLDSAVIGSSRATTTGSRQTRSVHSGSARLRSARLGAGLTRVPPAPEIDASKALMANPEVPEDKRVCPNCETPVGRSREGRPGRTEGFCPKCGSQFSFTPKLKPGDLVAGQYEVAGCLAHGGLGWIYLARDRNVSNRWVVLKGLLNSGDPDALAVAIAEQQFLAQVEHPSIVEIYNFVTFDGAGYIVMEYVGGTSLKQILKARMRAAGGRYDPLPVDQAIAYILEILPAFQYLHDRGLVYCDFKPDNLIQVGDAVKLIDMGGVRRLDDEDSAIYGTVGYQAPEVAAVGTSVASDIYTIGRTLLVLIMEFRGYQTRYIASLPPVEETPLFQQQDSLYRLLAKACAPDPADRFASADELRVQLLGVLREVVAQQTPGNTLTSAASVLFEAPAITGDALDWSELPVLRRDTSDPQHTWLETIPLDDAEGRLRALEAAPGQSAEVRLARAHTALELDRPELVAVVVDELLADDPWEWRAVWVSGLAALQRADFRAAQAAFNAVYGQVPGELAPKLALALACERGGEGAIAESLYGICASTDAAYVAPAAFGLARIRAARGDTAAAVSALDLVPSTSRGFVDARRQRATHLYESDGGLPALSQAMASIDGVRLDPTDRSWLTVQILEKALAEVEGSAPRKAAAIGPYPAEEMSLRDGLEATYRALAGSATAEEARSELVDRANAVRRWTLT